MEHHRLGVDSTSILLKEFDAKTVDLDQLIIPGEVQYTLEGFFKYTNDESPEDLFGFQTELILQKSVDGDSIRSYTRSASGSRKLRGVRSFSYGRYIFLAPCSYCWQ